MKRKFLMEVKVRNCTTVFAEGMDPGVLAQQTLTIDVPKFYSEAMLAMQIHEHGRELTDFAVEVVVKEVT